MLRAFPEKDENTCVPCLVSEKQAEEDRNLKFSIEPLTCFYNDFN